MLSAMMIRVVYNNDRYDMVKPYVLQSLIKFCLIKKFLRSAGWAAIGIDPIRSSIPSLLYSGSERRKADTKASLPIRLFSTPFSVTRTQDTQIEYSRVTFNAEVRR